MESVQPVELSSFMLAVIAGAMVVLCGALYAVAFAIGKLTGLAWLVRLSYLFYGLLAVSVMVLTRSLQFSGAWELLTLFLLVGYLVAPQLIWHLCGATHRHDLESEALSISSRRNNP